MRLNLWSILLVMALVFGLGFEALKHAKMRGSNDDAALKQALNRMEYEPYARNTENDPDATPANTKVADNSEYKFPENHTIVGQQPPVAPRGVVKYEGKDKAKDKKKKKKKKKKIETVAKIPERPDHVNDDEDEEEEAPVTNVGVNEPESKQQPVNPAIKKAQLSYDEWAAKLLNQPNPQATQEFIRAYQTGQVSAEIFYKIVREMIGHSNDEMVGLGILCASQTPSYPSFVVLIGILENNSSSPTAKSRSETALNTYSQVSYLPILESVIRSSSSTTALLAATKRLNVSAQNAKKLWLAKLQRAQQQSGGTTPPPTNPPNTPPTATTTKNPYARYFTRFVDLLNKIKSTNSSVSASAQEALNSINSLLT